MKNETIYKLIQLWEPLEEERRYLRLPKSWDLPQKPTKRQLPRLSIRTWDAATDWFRMMSIYWTIGHLVRHLQRTQKLPRAVDRDAVLIAAWKLGDYIKLARDAELRFFIERLQQLAYAVIAGLDEADS